MKIVLAIHNYYNDPNTGAMHIIRTIMKWLAEAGHQCHVLSTARIDTEAPLDPQQHLEKLGVQVQYQAPPKRYVKKAGKVRRAPAGKPVLHYTFDGVHVTTLLTEHNLPSKPDRAEGEQFMTLLTKQMDEVKPDVLLTYGRHAVVVRSLRLARQRKIATVVTLQNEGTTDMAYFQDIDHLFTCSRFLTDLYREQLGVVSTPLTPALDWSQIVAPESSRAFVTFVNPSLHKGASVFAQLANMLGSKRPDIPILVIQSAQSAALLNSVSDIDFSKYPQIMAAPPTNTPAEFLALTKILLVPSVWAEPFGRVAAEAMINGIPPLVGNRGALPDVVGWDDPQGAGGRVLPIPDWLDRNTPKVISEEEALPWFDAVCQLWDDQDAYQELATRARAIAQERYSEEALRRQYLDYFTSLEPGGSVLE